MAERIGDRVKDRSDTSGRTFLGEGSQARVYDIGGGRIRKEPKSLEEAAASISEWYDGSSQGTPEEYAVMLERYRQKGLAYVSDLITRHPETAWFFGNPTIDDRGRVDQDKLVPLGDYMLRHGSLDEKKAIINEYVGSIKISWKLGCYDWTFNLLGNCGVNETGAVVMLDFGEMGYSKTTAHAMIDERKWESAWDASQMDPETREYYFGAMKAALTHETLDARWRKIADS